MLKRVSLRKLKEGFTPEQYEALYQDHIPLAKTLPGIKRATIALVRDRKNQPAPYYRMTELYWDNYEAFEKSLSSPEGQATLKDELRFNYMHGDWLIFLAEETVIVP